MIIEASDLFDVALRARNQSSMLNLFGFPPQFSSVSPSRRYSFRAALRFVILTYRENGFVALFRGNSASLARVVPYAAIQFASHEEFKHLLGVDRNACERTFAKIEYFLFYPP